MCVRLVEGMHADVPSESMFLAADTQRWTVGKLLPFIVNSWSRPLSFLSHPAHCTHPPKRPTLSLSVCAIHPRCCPSASALTPVVHSLPPPRSARACGVVTLPHLQPHPPSLDSVWAPCTNFDIPCTYYHQPSRRLSLVAHSIPRQLCHRQRTGSASCALLQRSTSPIQLLLRHALVAYSNHDTLHSSCDVAYPWIA